MENYITVDCTGSFLKNAGIVGFVKFAEYNHAVEGNDYIIDGQNLHISVEYLKNNDISQMYVDTIAEVLEQTVGTKFNDIANKFNNLKNSIDSGKISIEDKNITDFFESFTKVFDLPPTTIENLKNYSNEFDISSKVEFIKNKNQDNNTKLNYCSQIINLLNNKRFKNILVFKEFLFKGDLKHKIFFGINKFFKVGNEGKTFFNSKKYALKIEELYNSDFINPIFEELSVDNKKKKTICIECLENTSIKIENSFMNDTADDLRRKKSHYWNCNPDAFVCPNCAFIYSFVPLGFAFFGNDAVFINNNQSIKELYSVMNTYKLKTESNPNETYYQRLFKIFSSEKISALEHNIHNIQVIVRNGNLSHYDMKIIDNDIISKMVECQKHHYFTNIEKKYLKIGTDFINVYNSVLDNILMRRSQYNFIDKCLKYEFSQECEKKSCNYGYIKNILNIEINFNGGSAIMEKEKKKSYVNNLMTKVNIAFEVGKSMRISILGENALNDSKEKDNSLRGYVYRLINLASVGDISQFMDTILRTYSGYDLTIPDIFKDCYQSEETFKAIAHGYILGLKYVKYQKDNNNEDNQGGENNG